MKFCRILRNYQKKLKKLNNKSILLNNISNKHNNKKNKMRKNYKA